jgi:hypothetical protein
VRRTKKVIAAEVLQAASQGRFTELTDLSSTYSHVALFNNNSNAAAWEQLKQLAAQQGDTLPAGAAAAAPAPAEGDTPAEQQQEQQAQQGQQRQLVVGSSNGRSSSLSLCRSSGLGSFRQQVWIHSQSQSVFDAELAGTQDAALAAALTATEPSADAAAAAAAADAGMTEASAPGSSKPAKPNDTAAAAAAAEADEAQVQLPPWQPLTPAVQQQQLKLLPNLGYACLCMIMRKYDIFNSRDCVKKTRDAADGLHKVSELALQNARWVWGFGLRGEG